ncbi:hypothetical protein D3C71_1226020 [compost metagenome]
MNGGRVAFMTADAVTRINQFERGHFAIAADLGQNRCRRDGRNLAIALHYRFGAHRQFRATVAVDHRQFRLNVQPGDRALHGQHGGVQDIQFVDFFDFGASDAPAQGFFADFVVELFAAGFGEFLRVVQAQNRLVRVEDHRRRYHGTTERTASDFIDAGNQIFNFSNQGEIQSHLHACLTHCTWSIRLSTASAAWLEASRRRVR